MIATTAWLIFVGLGYVVYPVVVFPLRYGRWPYAYPSRSSAYALRDAGLCLLLTGGTIWMALDPPRRWAGGFAQWAGLACIAGAFCARALTLAALGPHFRTGYDPRDQSHEFITRGPYRYVRHPLNGALVVAAAGTGLMSGWSPVSVALTAGCVLYALSQNRAEDRLRRARAGPATPASATR